MPHLDLAIATAGLLVGFSVGLTGMGGGALTTPILILLFKVPAVAAVGTDLVASVVMKLVGGGVHVRAGTVHWRLVRRLSAVSVPAVISGVLFLRAVGPEQVQALVQRAVGVALLAGAGASLLRWEPVRSRLLHRPATVLTSEHPADHTDRPALTLVAGALVGFVVGMTSVGSGSLMVAALAWLYPRLRSAELVGTDLVQAFILVTAGALAHLVLGDVRFGVAGSLLVGAVPGVLVGARLSSRAPDHLVRPALVTLLVATGLKLL